MAGLTDDQLKAITDTEMRQAVGYWGGKLEDMRRKNEYYFLGLAKGDLSPPEIEGRSRVVDTTVRNTVLGMMAPLVKTFCGSENVVEFGPTTAGDDDKAQEATDYLYYLLMKKNPGYTIISTWIQDALTQKNGIIKVWWDDSLIETREQYNGQTPVDLALILDDPEIEPIEKTEYEDPEAAKQKAQLLQQMEAQLQQLQAVAAQQPGQPATPDGPQGLGQPAQLSPAEQQLQQAQQQYEQFKAQPPAMLYDITVKRKKSGGRLRIENVPPEEFLISRRAKTIADTPFCGHRVSRTISDLKSMGYKNVEQITTDDDHGSVLNAEAIERASYDDADPYSAIEQNSFDPSQRRVWLTECYLKADVDGDGIAEWRKVVRAGNQILDNEECDGPPFVSICPLPLPHRFFGLCPADLAMEAQRIQTSLLRAQLDNVYLQVNGRYFAVEGKVNLDDLLTSRPGGVVRVKDPGAVGRLDQGVADSGNAMQMLEWFENYAEESTGWTRQSQGGNGLQLNQTATQSNIITNRADSRVEIISRTFAETGFTDLFKLMLKLVCQHQNRAEMMKLGDKWVEIDPREWTNQFDLTINVGLGTGNKDQLVQHLMALQQVQAHGMQIGIATPENIYHSATKLSNALGFKNANLFFTDPTAPPDPNSPPPPPKPDPEMVKIQAQAQATQQQIQLKAQLDQQAEQARQQFEAAKIQLQQQADQQKAHLDLLVAQAQQRYQGEQAAQENELEARRELLKQQHEAMLKEMELAYKRWSDELKAATAIAQAQIAAKASVLPSMLDAENSADQAVEGATHEA
ncbi:MAG TPA: hypothetical protein VF472_21800 [Burkholderiaceae bacterium]